MANTIHIKSIDSLYFLSNAISTTKSSIESKCGRIDARSYDTINDMYNYVSRIEAAYQSANDELERAEYEYSNYVNYTDEEDIDQYYLSSLRSQINIAKDRLNQVVSDLHEAKGILNKTYSYANTLRSSTSKFISSYSMLSDSAASTLRNLANTATLYKDTK